MEDNQSTAGHEFEDVIIEEVIESVTEEESEPPVVGEVMTELTEVASRLCEPKGLITPTPKRCYCRQMTILAFISLCKTPWKRRLNIPTYLSRAFINAMA